MRRLLLAAACLAALTAEAAEPAREPFAGCTWEPFESQELGIRLRVQNCADPKMHYVFSAKNGWLEQHRPADDTTFNGPQIIRVLSKPADKEIREAIAQQFIAALTDDEAKTSCKVRGFVNPAVQGRGKRLFHIVPTGAYAEKIERKLEQEPGDFGCGEFGAGQSTAYFEYHPDETNTQFLYVDTGQDEPLFDEDSIEFLPR